MRYAVALAEAVLQELSNPKRFSSKICRQILLKAFTLGAEPRPPDSKKLDENFYRVTIGEYRIIYEIDDNQKRVNIYLVDKRSDDTVYRRWQRHS